MYAAKVIDTASLLRVLSGYRLSDGVWVKTDGAGYAGTFRAGPPVQPKIRVSKRPAQITDSRRMTHAGPTPSERALSRVTVGLLVNVNTKSADMKTYTRLTRARAYLASRVKRQTADRDAPRTYTVLTPPPIRRVAKDLF